MMIHAVRLAQHPFFQISLQVLAEIRFFPDSCAASFSKHAATIQLFNFITLRSIHYLSSLSRTT